MCACQNNTLNTPKFRHYFFLNTTYFKKTFYLLRFFNNRGGQK